VNSWTTIVELISVWKRLIEFENNLKKTKGTAKEF
jgi:ABC-type long-subunit fatty acid transport system fused permease/ATPase subunit